MYNFITENNRKPISFILGVLGVFFIIVCLVFLIKFNNQTDTDYLTLTMFIIFLVLGLTAFINWVLISNICWNSELFTETYDIREKYDKVMK